MKYITHILIVLFIASASIGCSNVRKTDRADLSKDEHKPMRDRYSDTKRDNTPGHQNRGND